MAELLLFAGTTEGRLLGEYLKDKNIPAAVCVATEYGESMLTENDLLEIIVGRMNKDEMSSFIKSRDFKMVIDATHPYAALVTDNIREACKETQVRYIRVLRESIDEKEVILFHSMEETVDFLNTHEGNALITTGSKELEAFTGVDNYQKRLTARVLPMAEVVKKCTELGFQGRNLICMQGPFSVEMNELMLKESGSAYLVTKESGTYGGFMEKIKAAKNAGAKVLVIKRPRDETGFSMEEVIQLIEKMIEV
jgi:precorrin-6x reductase